MDKMKMQSTDITAQNIEKIGAIFPNCITEMLDKENSRVENKVYKKAINFELLKQMVTKPTNLHGLAKRRLSLRQTSQYERRLDLAKMRAQTGTTRKICISKATILRF